MACPASPPRAVCGLHLPLPSSWSWGCGGVPVCAAGAVTPLLVLPWPGLGWVGAWPGFWTRDTPKKPTPGGRSLLTPELSDGGGIANEKPPREFPFWKVGSSPFMTFSRGGGGGTGWAYGSDTICVMTSAPTRPLSSVNSWEGPGRQAAKAVGVGVGWLEWGPAPLAQGGAGVPKSQAGRAGTIRVPGTREAVTTSCWALTADSPRSGQRRLPTTILVRPGWHLTPSGGPLCGCLPGPLVGSDLCPGAPTPLAGTLNSRPGSSLSQEIGFIFPAGVWLLRRVTPSMKLGPSWFGFPLLPPASPPPPFTEHLLCARHFTPVTSHYLHDSPVRQGSSLGTITPLWFPRRLQGVLLGESPLRR